MIMLQVSRWPQDPRHPTDIGTTKELASNLGREKGEGNGDDDEQSLRLGQAVHDE